MPTLSKLSDKCKKCSNVNNCNNKRMEACALAEMPKKDMSEITVNIAVPNMQPMLRDTSLQALMTEQLEKDIYKRILNINCAFK